MGSTAGQVALGAGLVAASFVPGLNVAVAGGLFSAGIGIGLGAASAALQPTPETPKPGAINRTVRSASSVEQIVYGQARVGGSIVAIDRHTVQKSGPDADYLDLVIVLSARPVDALLGIYMGDQFFTLTPNTSQSATPYLPSNMLVPTDGKFRGYLGVAFADGTQTAASQFMINRRDDDGPGRQPSIVWTAQHKLTGYAYVIVTMRYRQDIYPSGIPNLSFAIRGAKVYDPRTGLTAYTDNAALCIADYLASEYGPPGASYGNINQAALIAAANVCDESVEHDLAGLSIPGISAATVTEARYRLSALISAADGYRQVAPRLAQAIGGGIFQVAAGWYIVAGAPVAPTVQLGEDDMVGDLEVLPRRTRRDLFNRVQVVARNEHDKHQIWDAPPLAPERYLLQDAGRILINAIDMTSTVASPTQAMRLASIELEQNRQQIAVTGIFKWRALTVEVGDVVELTSKREGWSDKPFRVVRWELDLEEGVRLALAEYCDAIYAYPPDAALGDCASDTDLLVAPSDFQATNVLVIRENVGDSRITWTAALSPGVVGYEARWKPIGELPSDRHAITDGTWIALEADPLPDWATYDVAAVTVQIDAAMDRSLVYRVEVRSIIVGGGAGDWMGINSFPDPGGTQRRSVALLSSSDELSGPDTKLLSGDAAPGGITLSGDLQ